MDNDTLDSLAELGHHPVGWLMPAARGIRTPIMAIPIPLFQCPKCYALVLEPLSHDLSHPDDGE